MSIHPGMGSGGDRWRLLRRIDTLKAEHERLSAENAHLRQAMTEGARLLEIDGDERGVAHLLREAMSPNTSVRGAAKPSPTMRQAADELEGTAQRGEIERLREALEWIGDNGPDDAWGLREKARQALQPNAG
jgi:hypothetical protein